MLTDLAAACRKSGLTVVPISGWQLRRRPGAFAPKGIICHHTAGTNDGLDDARWMALTGRSDLPAPLAQLALSRNGTVYVMAAGRSNHAGRVNRGGNLPASSDGNALYIGIEAQHAGVTEDWTEVQYAAYVRLVAALCLHYGWPVENVRGHKETSTTGKVDPSFSMPKFRSDVAGMVSDMLEAAAPPQRPEPAAGGIETMRGWPGKLRRAATAAADRGQTTLADRLNQAADTTQATLETLRKIKKR